MDEKEKKSKIALTALLHDIGKFYQRTGKKIDKQYYESFMKKNGYKHASFTAQFIEKFLDSKFGSLLVPAAEHHTTTSSTVKTADIYASSHDRKSESDSMEEEQASNYITDRLVSIFYILFNINENKKTYINLSKYTEYFPSEKVKYTNKDDSMKEYEDLFKEMVEKVKEIKAKDYLSLHHQLYPIFAQYTSSIPSSTYNVEIPTIGLFDHLKLTTAIATCIDENDSNKLMIVDYDLSGIQSFIYRITEGSQAKPKVAKSLRVRSLYLNLLCDFIAYSIINEFNLSYENVLYTSGGRGQILIPNKEDTKDRLNRLISKITKEIYKIHNIDLTFIFNSVPIELKDLQEAKFKEKIYGEDREVLVRKNQKLLSLINEKDFSFINEPIKKLCKLCQTNEAIKEESCDFCNKLIDFNENILAKTNSFVVEFDYSNTKKVGDIFFEVGSLGRIIVHSNFTSDMINPLSYYESFNCETVGEMKFYAKTNISDISFEDIAKKSIGDEKLAVIKMDVDNLGWIFNNGFQEGKYTLSKILTLSRNLDFFFSKIIIDIANDKKYKNSVYTIYSGGDDVAVVLPASMSLDFICKVNSKFSAYTGYNKEFHLSSGIEIFLPKSPVRFAIKRADEQLAAAKSTENKSSVGILDCIVDNNSLSHIISEINSYREAIEDNKLSRTSLYNLYLSIKLSLDNKSDPYAFQRFIPNIAYSISRNIPTDSEWFDRIKNTFIIRDISREILEKYKIIYSYVLMITREEKGNAK